MKLKVFLQNLICKNQAKHVKILSFHEKSSKSAHLCESEPHSLRYIPIFAIKYVFLDALQHQNSNLFQ